MQIKYKLTLSLCLLFGVVLSMNLALAEKREQMKSESSSPVKIRDNNTKSLLAEEGSDVICAIVIMPKSYRAAFERFSRRRIARKIRILPAKFEWSQGKMVFMPETAILKDDNPLPNKAN